MAERCSPTRAEAGAVSVSTLGRQGLQGTEQNARPVDRRLASLGLPVSLQGTKRNSPQRGPSERQHPTRDLGTTQFSQSPLGRGGSPFLLTVRSHSGRRERPPKPGLVLTLTKMGSLLVAVAMGGLVPALATASLQLPGLWPLSWVLQPHFTNPRINTEVSISRDSTPIRFRD